MMAIGRGFCTTWFDAMRSSFQTLLKSCGPQNIKTGVDLKAELMPRNNCSLDSESLENSTFDFA